MKIIRKMTVPPAVLAVKKSMGTLDKVISMIESKKNYAATIQQIDAAMGLATAAKRSLMATLLEDTVKAGAKNPKKLVTDLVNRKVAEDLPVTWRMESYNEAIADGALAFFKEKYGQEVKVYSVGDFSKELCGGPHVEHSKQVGPLTITAEQSVGSGGRLACASVRAFAA